MKNDFVPKPDYPELVEGLFLFLRLGAQLRKKGQCFDKLSIDGFRGMLKPERLS